MSCDRGKDGILSLPPMILVPVTTLLTATVLATMHRAKGAFASPQANFFTTIFVALVALPNHEFFASATGVKSKKYSPPLDRKPNTSGFAFDFAVRIKRLRNFLNLHFAAEHMFVPLIQESAQNDAHHASNQEQPQGQRLPPGERIRQSKNQ